MQRIAVATSTPRSEPAAGCGVGAGLAEAARVHGVGADDQPEDHELEAGDPRKHRHGRLRPRDDHRAGDDRHEAGEGEPPTSVDVLVGDRVDHVDHASNDPDGADDRGEHGDGLERIPEYDHAGEDPEDADEADESGRDHVVCECADQTKESEDDELDPEQDREHGEGLARPHHDGDAQTQRDDSDQHDRRPFAGEQH